MILADDITHSASTPTAMDNIDFDFNIAAAFSSPVDTSFVAKSSTGGSHNDESIFPALDYESDGNLANDFISRETDTPDGGPTFS
jgi:hypothetical protein